MSIFRRTASGDGDVELLSSDEFHMAVDSTVASTGFTVEELRVQAKEGSFQSDRARIAWDIVRAAERIPLDA